MWSFDLDMDLKVPSFKGELFFFKARPYFWHEIRATENSLAKVDVLRKLLRKTRDQLITI